MLRVHGSLPNLAVGWASQKNCKNDPGDSDAIEAPRHSPPPPPLDRQQGPDGQPHGLRAPGHLRQGRHANPVPGRRDPLAGKWWRRPGRPVRHLDAQEGRNLGRRRAASTASPIEPLVSSEGAIVSRPSIIPIFPISYILLGSVSLALIFPSGDKRGDKQRIQSLYSAYGNSAQQDRRNAP